MGQGGVWEGRSPVTLLLTQLAAAEVASHLAPALEMLPTGSSPSSLSLPTFCRQHAFLDASPGRGAADHVPLLLQQVQATVSSVAGRAEGNIPTHPAGREVYTEGRNAGTFAAVTARDHVHGMRQGSGGVRGLTGGSPVPEGRQMQTHLE